MKKVFVHGQTLYEVRKFSDLVWLKMKKTPFRFFFYHMRWAYAGYLAATVFTLLTTKPKPYWIWLEGGIILFLALCGALLSIDETHRQWKNMTEGPNEKPDSRLKVVR